MEKGNEARTGERETQTGEWIETFAGGPVNPVERMSALTAGAGADFVEDANGDLWWQPDGPDSPWVLHDRLEERLPVEKDDWKRRHPDEGK